MKQQYRGLSTYSVFNTASVGTGTVVATSTSIIWAFKPALPNLFRTRLQKAFYGQVNGNGGSLRVRLNRITVQGTGGAALTPKPHNSRLPPSVLTARSNAPTGIVRDATPWVVLPFGGSENVRHVIDLEELFEGRPPELDAGVSEGWEWETQVFTVMTAQASVFAGFIWTEQPIR